MTRIFIIENEIQENKFFKKKLGGKVFDSFDSKDSSFSIKQAEQALSDDCVIYEIKMPEVNAGGFIRILHQGSITATIPFSSLHDRPSNLEQYKDINFETDKHLGEFSNLTELVKKITDLKQCLQTTQLKKQSIFNNHWSANQSQQTLEPLPTKTTKSTDDKSKFSQDPLMNQVFQFIDRNYHLTITLCDVALAVGYSSAYLTDLVRRQTGKTVNHWIIERRMTAARQLLLETNQSVNQVALAVGYQHEGHFFRQFRQHHGTTPQAWRKIQRSQDQHQIEAKELRVSQKDCAL
uniref:Putative two component transcriptional regulator AraC family n=1 Tax=Nostoc sp. (strain PCC 8009) TaxID=29413 RepID=A0A2P0ZGQ8_NOSS8|nr:putative two component transcriptional regulator AraC family [Nostoc sp. PCC 8009]